jgi:hypothetical protein
LLFASPRNHRTAKAFLKFLRLTTDNLETLNDFGHFFRGQRHGPELCHSIIPAR